MEKIVETLKAHPMIAIGAALVLFLLMRAGGSSASPDTVSASLQSQSLASDTNVAMAGINADVQKAQSAGAYAFMSSLAGFASETAIARSTNDAGIFANILERQNNQELIAAQSEYDRQYLETNQAIAFKGFDTEYAMLSSTNATQKAMAEISANTALKSTEMTLASGERSLAAKLDTEYHLGVYGMENERHIAFEHYNTERVAMQYNQSSEVLQYKLGRGQQKNDRNLGYLDQANRAFATYMSFGASEM